MGKFDRQLRKVFKKITPDNLDSVLSDLGQQKGDGVQVQKMEKNFGWKNVTAIAASAVLIVGISIAGIKLIGSGSHATPGTEPNLETVMPTQTVTPTETVKPTLPEGVNLTEMEAITRAGQYSSATFMSRIFLNESYKASATLVNSDDREYEYEHPSSPVYVVNMQYDGYVYTYDVSAERGEIWAETIDRLSPDVPLHWKMARDIALEDAEEELYFQSYFKLTPDSRKELKNYNISFRRSPYQYEYTVDAYTGEILSCKKEEVGYEADEQVLKEENLRQSAILVTTVRKKLALNQLIYFDAEPVYDGERVVQYLVLTQREGETIERYAKNVGDYDDGTSSW